MKTCQDYHHKCNADCCRLFVLDDVNKSVYKFKTNNKDIQKYYRLRGARIVRDTIIINIKDYRIVKENNKLLMYRDCDWLDNDTLLCKHHDIKPLICRELNWDTKDLKKFYLTPNCMFNEKK